MTSFYLSVRRNLTVVLLMLSLAAWAQERTVSGRITASEDGSAVPGVNVVEKGTSNGTTSDMDGNFKINVTSGDAVLSFSFIGFVSQEVTVGNQTTINVSLQSDVTTLSEVVVVGYGQQEKRDVTGVVAEVKSTLFNKGAIVAPDQLIAGKIAGVQITPNSGEPGTGGTVRIRGGTSINASNDPLYVIDGVPLDITGVAGARNPLNFINPNDIETFTVLKDASAAAIYGARAANGVVMITTKRGKAGEAKVTYDGFYSQSEITKKMNLLDGPQFREAVDLFFPSRTPLLYDYNLVESATVKKTNTAWQDQVLQTAVGQSHNVGFSAGTEKAQVRASFGYLDQQGIIKTSSTKRTSFSLNVDQYFMNNKLKVESSIKASETKDYYNGGGIGQAYDMAPSQPVYDTAAAPQWGGYWEWSSVPLGSKNPVATIDMTKSQGVVYRGIGSIRFDYNFEDVVPGLNADLNLAVDVTSGIRNFFQPTNLWARTGPNPGYPGITQTDNTNRINKLLEFYVRYEKSLASLDGKFDVTGGYSYQNFSQGGNGYTADSLTTDIYGFYKPEVAGRVIPYNVLNENRLISFFGRVNFSMKDKYLVTVNMRSDGSTRFGPANRWGFFPSAAFGWRIYNEDFFASLQNIFSDMKVRVSWGINGNQEIGNYAYLPVFTGTNGLAEYPFGSIYISPVKPNAVDPNLKWEETTSLNLGLDFGLLKGRLTGSMEYYNKDTKDLLFTVNVPAGTLTGDKVLTNIGSVNNKGFELTLNGVAIDKSDLRWDIGFNISMNRSEVTELDGNDDPNFQGYPTGGISGGLSNTIQVLKVGYPVNTFRVYEHINGPDGKPLTDGVDWNGDGLANDLDMYVDANGDGILNDLDRRPDALAYPQPKWFLGVTSNTTWKNFDFSFTLRGNLGGQVYNNVVSSKGYLNRIVELVPTNLVTDALNTNFKAPQYFSNYYLEDATFVRMDNITLGYTVQKLAAMKIRLYATVQNAFVWSKYKGLDPEVVNGIDNNLYPRARTYVFGINIGF